MPWGVRVAGDAREGRTERKKLVRGGQGVVQGVRRGRAVDGGSTKHAACACGTLWGAGWRARQAHGCRPRPAAAAAAAAPAAAAWRALSVLVRRLLRGQQAEPLLARGALAAEFVVRAEACGVRRLRGHAVGRHLLRGGGGGGRAGEV